MSAPHFVPSTVYLPIQVGVIGCGTISDAYFTISQRLTAFQIVACADIDPARAQAKAAQYGLRAVSVEHLLADPEITIVLNLTIPQAHATVARQALEAGKSVYNEKPLALNRADGQSLLALAEARGLRIGGAPDTFLGGGLQTCRALLAAGAIGEPVAATAFMLSHGHESWHPAPQFYYQEGGGPLFDMGPYYLTALVALLGPIRRVSSSARTTFPTRTITSQPLAGTMIPVETPTHLASVLDFASGAIGTLVTSFDVWATHTPLMEIYGTQGTLSVPDPNTFGGPVHLWQVDVPTWREVPLSHGFTDNNRGIGLAEMAYAMAAGRPERANGHLAAHVLDVMQAIGESAEAACHVEIATVADAFIQPTPLPVGNDETILR